MTVRLGDDFWSSKELDVRRLVALIIVGICAVGSAVAGPVRGSEKYWDWVAIEDPVLRKLMSNMEPEEHFVALGVALKELKSAIRKLQYEGKSRNQIACAWAAGYLYLGIYTDKKAVNIKLNFDKTAKIYSSACGLSMSLEDTERLLPRYDNTARLSGIKSRSLGGTVAGDRYADAWALGDRVGELVAAAAFHDADKIGIGIQPQ